MNMSEERKQELLVVFAGFISAIPYTDRINITDELNEVLIAIGVREEVSNPG